MILFVFSFSGLAFHVYDAGNVVHALVHGRSVLFGAVVHIQQPRHGQYVRARYPYRGQFGQLLIPRVRRYDRSERVESSANSVHARPFSGVGLYPPGSGHVFAVPSGRSGGAGGDRGGLQRAVRRTLCRRGAGLVGWSGFVGNGTVLHSVSDTVFANNGDVLSDSPFGQV